MTPETQDAIAARVRATCARLKPGERIDSVELAARAWPPTMPGYDLQRDAFKALRRDAAWMDRLGDNWSRGDTTTIKQYGREVKIRPFLWHLPKVRCPHCQGTGYIEGEF